MAKQTLSILFLLTLTTFIPSNNASFSQHFSKAQVGLDKTQLTHLSFYWHDTVTGPNPSAVEIAKSTITDTSATSFGRLTMIDDPLTEGPANTSKVVGQAQGMYAAADLKVNALTMIMNFYFTEGEFNGSTLSVLGRDPVLEGARELPVVGGTGSFRFAKGYAQLTTQMFDQKTGNAVVKYDVYVSHADSSGAEAPGSGDSGSGSGSGSGSPGTNKSSGGVTGQASFSTLASILVMIGCILLN